MVRHFSVLSGSDGPTAVFFAGKLGSFIPVVIALLTAVIAAAIVLLLKKRR